MTQEEFKELFELHEDCKVTKATVKKFEKVVLGAYLLHHKVMNTDKKIKTTFTSGNKVVLTSHSDGNSSWRDHIMGIGSLPIIWVYYKRNKDDRSYPFWTYHPEENEGNIDIAYSLWGAEFTKISAMHASKYGVKMKIKLDKYGTTNRWFFRTRGIEIITPIFYKDEKGLDKEISSWDMRQVITQQSNVFLGRIPAPIQAVINDYNEKNKKLKHEL